MDHNEDLEFQSLIDLLIVYIHEYDKMLASKVYTVDEFTHCRQKLAELHTQIKAKGEQLGYSMDRILPSFPEDTPAANISH